MAKTVHYRDLDLNFSRHPISNDTAMLVETESVKRALRNLLRFKRFEKPFHPEIDSGIQDMLFELVSPLQINKLKDVIRELIAKYEPRVILHTLDIRSNLDDGDVQIDIKFTVINFQNVISFSLDLSRSR